MEKPSKEPVRRIRVVTGPVRYQMESLIDQNMPNPESLEELVIDFSLRPEVAKLCKKLGLNYLAISPDEEKTAALKKKLKFPDRFCTGISY